MNFYQFKHRQVELRLKLTDCALCRTGTDRANSTFLRLYRGDHVDKELEKSS